jgi:hypothetical protein
MAARKDQFRPRNRPRKQTKELTPGIIDVTAVARKEIAGSHFRY